MVAKTRGALGVSTRILSNEQVLHAEGPREWKDVLDLGNELGIMFCILILTVLGTLIRGSFRIVSVLDEWSKVGLRECQLDTSEYESLYEESGIEDCRVPSRKWGDGSIDPDASVCQKSSRTLGRKRPRGRHKEGSIEKESSGLGMNDQSDKRRHLRSRSIPLTHTSSGSKPPSAGLTNRLPRSTPDSQSPSESTLQVSSSDSDSLLSVSDYQAPTTPAKMTGDSITVPLLVMPAPGTSGAPFFRGENITSFLEEWDYICKDYRIEGDAKRDRILRYIDVMYRDQVKAMQEYAGSPGEDGREYDEAKFYDALKKLYRDWDWENLKISRDFLFTVVKQAEQGHITTKAFIDVFHRISTALVQRSQLENLERCTLFMNGLPNNIVRKIIKDNKLDMDDVSTYKYAKMHQTALEEYGFEEKTRRYHESRDPDYSRIREDHLSHAVRGIVHAKDTEYPLPRPPPTFNVPEGQYGNKHEGNAPSGPISRSLTEWKDSTGAKPSSFATRADLDQLSKGFEKFSISAVSMETFEKGLQAQTAAMSELIRSALSAQNTAQPVSSRDQTMYGVNQNTYDGRGEFGYRRGGFGERGRGRGRSYGGRGGYGQSQGDYAYNAHIPSQQESVNVSAAYGVAQDRSCYACYGRKPNGEYDPNCDHTHSNQCPGMLELQKRGCIHKEEGRWCLGTWDPDKPSVDLNLRSDSPWLGQIHQRIRGTEWDFDPKARMANKQRLREDARVAAESRAKAYPEGDQRNETAPQGTVMQGNFAVLQRSQITPPAVNYSVGARAIETSLPDGRDLDDFYEERDIPDAFRVYAASRASRGKASATQEAKDIFRKRAAAEEKLPKAKSQRPSAYIPQETTAAPGDIDVDELTDEEIPRPDLHMSRYPETGGLDKDEEPPHRLPKSTAPLPKTQRGFKMISDYLKTPNPIATIRSQWMQDNRHYLELCNMAAGISSDMIQGGKAMGELAAVMEGIKSMQPGSIKPAQVQGIVLEGNQVSVSFDKLMANKWVVTTPKLEVNLKGPKGVGTHLVILDTGAECNILPLSVARQLGCAILSVEDFQLSSVSGELIRFAGMAKIRVEIEHGVGCEDMFFLIDYAPKILLGQPFVAKMKMTFLHREDGSWDGVFVDPEYPRSTCTVMVVPPLRQARRRRVTMQPYAEEISDEESDLGN